MKFPHVFLEIKVSAKAFSTDFTRKWLLVIVSVHVKCEVIDLMKCFVTYIAFVGLFTTMSQFMILIVTLLVEALPAELADKWLISCMDSRMCV